MIINTGMRTDIPAFYSEWFVNRLKAGFVLVRNPYNPHSVARYRLSPDVVDLIGFCTKNPAPIVPSQSWPHSQKNAASRKRQLSGWVPVSAAACARETYAAHVPVH